MPELLDITEVRGRYELLLAAHAEDRLSRCGCSKQTLRLCMDCGRVTCRCERLGLDTLRSVGRCPCEALPPIGGLITRENIWRPKR